MRLSAQAIPYHQVQADWLILGLSEDGPWPRAFQELDRYLDGALGRLKAQGDLRGKAREILPLYNVSGLGSPRLLIVGLGRPEKIDIASLMDTGRAAARLLTTRETQRLAFVLPEEFPSLRMEEIAGALAVGLWHGSEGAGIRKSTPERFPPEEIVLVAPPGVLDAITKAVREAESEARGVSLARELVNLPPSELYPESFAERARHVAEQAGLECQILEEKELEAERMGALLAVARGSDRPARLVVLRHPGPGPVLGLVGKGVTFDSGGLSLKTTEQMVDMKCDMAGAAAVLGAMQAAGELKIPANVIGVLALVENLPSGKAMKLGDVLRARNGKTIEVLNTDAEGRLILADALSYTVDQKANHLIDLATLTGACLVALGTEVAGLMTNNEAWSAKVLAGAARAGEKAWPLPMFPLYGELIKGSVADIRNTGGTRYAGAISAAKFLEEFVADVPWVHLDIAGPAWAERENSVRDAGGTGCFVRTLIEVVRAYADNAAEKAYQNP